MKIQSNEYSITATQKLSQYPRLRGMIHSKVPFSMRLPALILSLFVSLSLADAPLRKMLPRRAYELPADAAPELHIGGLTLTRCPQGIPAYCGWMQTPLDPAGQVPGSVTTSFEFYPHRGGGPGAGTIVAEEGGPGYSTTGTRSSYLGLFLPLMDRRDLLLVDKRGTGKSGAVNCPELQSAGGITLKNIAACGLRCARLPIFLERR